MSQISTRKNSSHELSGSRQSHPLDIIRRQFDNLFDQLSAGFSSPWDADDGRERNWDFSVRDVNNEYLVRAEMPGFEGSDLDVRLEDDR